MAAVPIATAAGAVLSSILGGLFSSSSQSSANTTNLQIARETNAQNKDLFFQQLAFAKDMWQKTNEWNSPQNQMAMLRKAGINPALGSEWQTAAQPGTPSAPAMQGATVQPVDYSWIGNSVNTGINAYYQNQLTNASTEKVKNDSASAKVKAELDAYALKYNLMKIVNDAHTSKWLKEQARLSMELMNRTQEDQVRQASWQTKIQEQTYEETIQRIAESKLRQRAQEIANQYAPRMNDTQLKQYQATIANMYSAVRANDASAAASYAQEALSLVQKEGKQIDNRTARNMASSLLSKASEEAKQAKYAAEGIMIQNEKLKAQNRYGELGYRVLGSALPEAENTIKEDIIGPAKRGLHAVTRGYRKGMNYKKPKQKSGWE